MKKKDKTKRPVKTGRANDYADVLSGIVGLLQDARHVSARAVNAVITVTYWEIGRRIVEFDQRGAEHAPYGSQLLQRLSADLIRKLGRGFSVDNLENMRQFYLVYPAAAISETASRKSSAAISETLSRKSGSLAVVSPVADLSARFQLPWSHYVQLLKVPEPATREFYEAEALRNGWTVRQLERQITTLFYERTLASRRKPAMLLKGAVRDPEDEMTPEDELKDPLVLEFLGLKDEYSESDLEEALIQQLESFLLELGGDFSFVGRQRRLRIGNEWYRVDLLFFHRRLRCLVVIDLKLGKFTHADAGQMTLYLNYARRHWTNPDENPPVGLILCTQKDTAVVHYALDGLHNKVLAAEYRTKLPAEKTLVAELERTRRKLESKK